MWERFTILIKATRAIIVDDSYLHKTFYMHMWCIVDKYSHASAMQINEEEAKVVIVLIFVGVKRKVCGLALSFFVIVLGE